MPYEAAFRDRILEALSPCGQITGRAMFGGYGLFERDAIFGLLDGHTLYLKTDAASQPRYRQAGSRPFNPHDDPEDTLFYFAVPDDVIVDPARLSDWVRGAIRVGHATKRPRRGKQ